MKATLQRRRRATIDIFLNFNLYPRIWPTGRNFDWHTLQFRDTNKYSNFNFRLANWSFGIHVRIQTWSFDLHLRILTCIWIPTCISECLWSPFYAFVLLAEKSKIKFFILNVSSAAQPYTPTIHSPHTEKRSASRILRLVVWWVGEVLLLTTLAEHCIKLIWIELNCNHAMCAKRVPGSPFSSVFANKK